MFATLRKAAFVKIYIIPLAAMIAGSMTGAIAILYALDLGANILQINLITTIQSTMGILLLVPFGILSDRLGRKPMILFSRAIIALGTLIRTLATDPNHLLIAAFVGGFAGGGFWPILLSMLGDIAKREEQQEAVSTLLVFSSLGMLLGPIICSLLLSLPGIALRDIYRIGLATQACVLIYMTTQIRETRPKIGKGEGIGYRANIGDLMRKRDFQGLLVMASLYAFSRSIMHTYIPIHARINLDLSDAEIASFATYRSLAIVIIRLSSATLLAQVPTRTLLIPALTLGGITGFAGLLGNSYESLALILFLSGLSYGAVAVSRNTLAAKASTYRNRGVTNSLSHLAESTGNITKILTSPIVDSVGLAPVFLLSGITALIAATPFFRPRQGSNELTSSRTK